MAKVIFQPSGRRGEVPKEISVIEASRLLGADIEALCGEKKVCGKCKVRIEEGFFEKYGVDSKLSHVSPWQDEEEKFIHTEERSAGFRLGCVASCRKNHGPANRWSARPHATYTLTTILRSNCTISKSKNHHLRNLPGILNGSVLNWKSNMTSKISALIYRRCGSCPGPCVKRIGKSRSAYGWIKKSFAFGRGILKPVMVWP